ncbi:hypothetical protein K505DRAFT_290301 [Melanomma pulvis-pyrius CBS 109.77]|uniref:Ubiquitin 3 binding protein But2 C-terminal domain-containing protein n=1 Tax=Melanomma pulvis-pyrius CBS 109.77 TaxID=1314802 RepID=A0A6A6WPS6_9PLEO|nr:hypothetical protein K505DRAFT_290301 [Melanomma pulvis-pyrius CBS 109.77]
MELFHLPLLVVPLSCALFVPASNQAALVDSHHHVEREKVPGDNPAYYTRGKAANQLFEIDEFTVSPNPVVSDHRVFFYLRGDTGTRDLPGLSNATLEIWAQQTSGEDKPEYTIKKKLSDFKPFTARNEDDYTYGGPLIKGSNEIVGDLWLIAWDPEGHRTVDLDIKAVARMPDDRVLFAFEASVSYEV